jgi:hypothetical protein
MEENAYTADPISSNMAKPVIGGIFPRNETALAQKSLHSRTSKFSKYRSGLQLETDGSPLIHM